MLFEDDFTVPVDLYGTYIDDDTVYDQITQMITDTDEPLYLHTTTMQNHQPYDQGTGDTEFENYLQWVEHSSDGLADFIDTLEDIEEPTIVLFIGDHFPSLRGEDGIYAQLGITSENCSTLYEQTYVIWNNFGLDMTEYQPTESISAFYLPYVIMEAIDLPRDSFIQSMMDEMETTPVYSTNYAPGQDRNEKLDTLTYDRILGDMLSPDALVEEQEESSTETD
jgi:arylsulfatase A-like enzyme